MSPKRENEDIRIDVARPPYRCERRPYALPAGRPGWTASCPHPRPRRLGGDLVGKPRALATRHRVYVPDLPGFGRTEKPGWMDYSPGAYSRFLLDFMAALDIGRAALVGHSLGGGVALRAILDDPGRADRLILVSSAGLGPNVSLPLRIASLPFFDRVFFSRPCPSSPAFSIVSSSTPPRSPPILRGSTTRCFSSPPPFGPSRGFCEPSPRSGAHGPGCWSPSGRGSSRSLPPRSSSGGARTASCPSARPLMPRGGFPGPACTSSSAAATCRTSSTPGSSTGGAGFPPRKDRR